MTLAGCGNSATGPPARAAADPPPGRPLPFVRVATGADHSNGASAAWAFLVRPARTIR
jgi:hypothetical protein